LVDSPRVNVFIAGATGYLGSALAPALLARGHGITALAREGSAARVDSRCRVVVGDALDGRTFGAAIDGCDTFIHLVGTPHPGPRKAALFRSVDLASARESIAAAVAAGVSHFVYVSVAQPAPIMKAYQAARADAEEALRASGLNATILRPWYVLGPGHRWPVALIPVYWLLERLPPTRDTARRLCLVTRPQMIDSLVGSVEHPAQGIRVIEASEIRNRQP
jgi:uncharacterized protein YbjT (DUF2867 family)